MIVLLTISMQAQSVVTENVTKSKEDSSTLEQEIMVHM